MTRQLSTLLAAGLPLVASLNTLIKQTRNRALRKILTQVREEVKRLKERMGEGGGYILEPGITVQGDVPLENLIAMLEEARVN